MPRVLKKVRIDPDTGCMVWTGSKTSNGYGQIHLDGRPVLVHRAVYEHVVGPIGANTIHHICAVRLCCNPEHLQAITDRENIAEMHERKALRRTIGDLRERLAAREREIAALHRRRRPAPPSGPGLFPDDPAGNAA